MIPAGGNVLLNHAWAAITALRETLNCTLPIEIIYNGPSEMDDWAIQKFEVRRLISARTLVYAHIWESYTYCNPCIF